MAASLLLGLLGLLHLLLCFLHGAVYAEDVIVTPGDDVTLKCRSADPNIVSVQWTRTDLRSEHVFFSIDGHPVLRNQHPSFKDRVQLVDGDLKHGDASLILKNVSSSDEGTYECRVRVDGSTRRKRFILETEPISRVRLKVTGSDHGDMQDGAMKNGAEKDGPMQDGPMQDGPMQDGAMKNGAEKDGPMQDGPMQDGPMQDGPMQDGPMQDGAMKNGAEKDGAEKDGAMQDGPMQDGPMQDGPMQDGPMQDGPMKDGAEKDGAKKDGAEKDGAMKDGANTNMHVGLPAAAAAAVSLFVCLL